MKIDILITKDQVQHRRERLEGSKAACLMEFAELLTELPPGVEIFLLSNKERRRRATHHALAIDMMDTSGEFRESTVPQGKPLSRPGNLGKTQSVVFDPLILNSPLVSTMFVASATHHYLDEDYSHKHKLKLEAKS
jgi:hypothetical protein